MGSLEHNIKDAFEAQETKNKFEGKEALWNRLEGTMHSRKGVAAFWRVAAIFIGVLFSVGVLAGISYRTTQKAEIAQLQKENNLLATEIESLQENIEHEGEPVIQFVEKEKIVYRDKIVYKESTNQNRDLEQNYLAMIDSIEVTKSSELQYKEQIRKLQTELESTQKELLAIQKQNNEDVERSKSAPFELKSERIELGVPKKPATKNPEMEVKVFQRNFIEDRNNLNKNILRK